MSKDCLQVSSSCVSFRELAELSHTTEEAQATWNTDLPFTRLQQNCTQLVAQLVATWLPKVL
jgi:hypothetical protein